MRHGGRTLLLLAKVLFRFANFGALQVADFGRDLVERGSNHGQRRNIVGVSVALDDLGCDGRGIQTESRANLLFVFRIEMAKIANCA